MFQILFLVSKWMGKNSIERGFHFNYDNFVKFYKSWDIIQIFHIKCERFYVAFISFLYCLYTFMKANKQRNEDEMEWLQHSGHLN